MAIDLPMGIFCYCGITSFKGLGFFKGSESLDLSRVMVNWHVFSFQSSSLCLLVHVMFMFIWDGEGFRFCRFHEGNLYQTRSLYLLTSGSQPAGGDWGMRTALLCSFQSWVTSVTLCLWEGIHLVHYFS